MKMPDNRPALPLGSSDFVDLIDNRMLYVDKTDAIAEMACDRAGRMLYLTRPHGFGKTLLLSAIKELYEHGLGRFAGLKIVMQNLWKEKIRKVLLLNFKDICKVEADSFYDRLWLHIKEQSIKAGLKRPDEERPYLKNDFEHALRNNQDEAVLLIDDFDAPLLEACLDRDRYKERYDILRGFLDTLKYLRESGYFALMLITGTTKAVETDEFNFCDRSLSSKYGSLFGFTQEELKRDFGPYLTRAARALRASRPAEGWTKHKVLSAIAEQYGGYTFDRDCQSKLLGTV